MAQGQYQTIGSILDPPKFLLETTVHLKVHMHEIL
jgi:hypothetical protein